MFVDDANRASPSLSDPSDPSPKDNPTRVPYPPKRADNKDADNRNEVLEKPGESVTQRIYHR